MKDSETLSRLIYRAFVLAQPGIVDGLEARAAFPAALEFYAKTRMRELIDEGKLELVPDSNAAPPAAKGPAAPAPESPTVLAAPTFAAEEVRPAIPDDTHTHTAGANDGGGGKRDAFAGKGAQEKREILEHLQRFVDTYSGARRRIAKEANGALTYEELLAMSEKKPLPLAKWRVAEAAMLRIEGQDQ